MTRSRWIATAVGLVVVGLVVILLVSLTRGGGDPPQVEQEATPSAVPSAAPSTLLPGSEIAPVKTQSPASPGATAASGLPAAAASDQAVVVDPSPSPASGVGTLVAGYPRRAAPVVPGSTIRSSSVSPSPGRLQVALDATTSAGPDDVLRFYAVRLARRGFVGTPAPAVGGSVATSFKRGADTVVVTVVAAGGGPRSYTVFANLSTKTS